MKHFYIVLILFILCVSGTTLAGHYGTDINITLIAGGGGAGGEPPTNSFFLLANKTDSFLLANKSDKLIIH